MKKIFSLILSLMVIFSLAACGNDTITMKDVYAAGQMDALLKNHESVKIQPAMGDTLIPGTYLTKDFVCDGDSDGAIILTDNGYYILEGGSYSRMLPLAQDGFMDIAAYRATKYASPVFSPGTVDEAIQSVTEDDKYISVTSDMNEEEWSDITEDLPGAVSSINKYVLDAKNHEIISSGATVGFEDGTEMEFVIDFIYDTEMPEIVKPVLEFESQTDNLRTVTIVFNPGTKKEITQNVQVPKGLPISVANADLSAGTIELYADADCTVPYAAPEGHDSDATVYVRWVD